MAKTETLNLEVKSNIKSVTKDTGVKTAFGKVIPMAKAMFGTIKAGIISTGIGVLLIAFGTLMTWLTKTKKGAEMLERVFAGVGAVINVIVDRITKFASAVGKLFSGNIKGGLRDLTGTFKGMGDEMSREISLAIELKAKLQVLTDSERELNVEFAQRRAEIEDLKMISEDLTKTEEERLRATKKAFKIENDLLDKRVENAEEHVKIQREQNELGESMADDLDALAEKEITLADIKAESATKQIELNNKINSIEAETKAKRQAGHTERLAEIEEAKQAELDRIRAVETAEVGLQNSITLLQIDDAMEREAELLHIQLLAE